MNRSIDEIVRGLELCADGQVGCQMNCPYDDVHACEKTLLRDAAETIKRLQPRIMTLDEACGADYAIIEFNTTRVKCSSLYPVSVYLSDDCRMLNIKRIGATDISADFSTYGYYFRCWTSAPTEDQRMAAVWE